MFGRKSVLHTIVVGILVGTFLFPAQPAQAQWTVHDPISLTAEVRQWLKEAQHWANEIQKYQTMIDKATQQITSLQNILSNAESLVTYNARLARFISDVGGIVRGSYQLKRQLEGQIRYRITWLKRIDDRLRDGIFSPEADLNDLESYLKYTIGRRANETVAELDRMARNDSVLEQLCIRREQIQKDIAFTRKNLKDLRERLEQERGKPAPDQANIAQINEMILAEERKLSDLEQQHADIQSKIAERAARYGLTVEDMENFAFQVRDTSQGWAALEDSQKKISDTMWNIVIQNNPNPQ